MLPIAQLRKKNILSNIRAAGLLTPLLLCLTPIALFYTLLFQQARPVPMFDDYHAILQFVLDLRQQPDLKDKFLFLFSAQHDEYKLIVEHLLISLDYGLTGQVHFIFLITLGNLMVLGIPILFFINFSLPEFRSRWRLFLFLPVVCLLFALNYVENLDWAMCVLQTVPVVLFSLASLHFATQQSRSAAWWASLCTLLAAFSSANGFLVAPVGLFLYLRSRRYRATLQLLLASGLALLIYRYHYVPIDPAGKIVSLAFSDKVRFFLTFIGGGVENMHHQPIAGAGFCVGLGLCLLFALSLARRQRNPFVFAVAAWCLLTAAAVTHGRSYLGVDMSLTGRYKIYSDLLLVCGYTLALQNLATLSFSVRPVRVFWAIALTATIAMLAGADRAGYQFLEKRQQRVRLGLEQYSADPEANSPEISLGGEVFGGYDPELARQTLKKALQAGIYHLPPSYASAARRGNPSGQHNVP